MTVDVIPCVLCQFFNSYDNACRLHEDKCTTLDFCSWAVKKSAKPDETDKKPQDVVFCKDCANSLVVISTKDSTEDNTVVCDCVFYGEHPKDWFCKDGKKR